jgi:hypothetical protein
MLQLQLGDLMQKKRSNDTKKREFVKQDIYRKIVEKIGNSDVIKGVILFSEEMKSNQRNGMDAQIMLVCEDLPEEELLYLQEAVSEALSPLSVELVLFSEIVDVTIRKDIIEQGVHCSTSV